MISNVSEAFRRDLAAQHKQGMQQGMKQGMQQGIQQGMQQGIVLSRRRIAKNLLGTGLDVAQVAKVTELTQSEVEKIKRELG